ncbi:hypothetical protein D3C79_923150 [compost metagenome]
MVVGIAEQYFDHGQAAHVMTHLTFLGDADSTVQLHSLLRHEACRTVDLHFGRSDGTATLKGVAIVHHHAGVIGHAARLLDHYQHVHGAVLQRLERADQHPKLLANLEVLDRHVESLLHGPDRLGAQRGHGAIHRLFDQRQGLP